MQLFTSLRRISDSQRSTSTPDTMAAEVQELLPAQKYPLRIIRALTSIFMRLGFYREYDDYYDPRNSFFKWGDFRRTGIPITLSLVYLEVARRIDFPMIGVGMPLHFLIRPAVAEMEILLMPFISVRFCLRKIVRNDLPKFTVNRSCCSRNSGVGDARQFLARMLSNLKSFTCTGGVGNFGSGWTNFVVSRMSVELRDRGLIYYQLGYWAAAGDFETYLAKAAMLRMPCDSPLAKPVGWNT